MIQLFDVPKMRVDLSYHDNVLHGPDVTIFEDAFKEYVGAKYACAVSSASMGIFLTLKRLNYVQKLRIPAILPPIVINTILQAGYSVEFTDNVDWVGSSYEIGQTQTNDFSIIDSAQRVDPGQFNTRMPQDVMIFSFYPTKPVGSIDGGMVVSDDKDKIDWIRQASLYGTTGNLPPFIGWKGYMNVAQARIAFQSFKNYIHRRREDTKAVCNLYNEIFDNGISSTHLYVVLPKDRNELIKLFKENDIAYGMHYKSLANNPMYKALKANDVDLPNSDLWEKHCVSIPMHPGLKIADVQKIVKLVKPCLA